MKPNFLFSILLASLVLSICSCRSKNAKLEKKDICLSQYPFGHFSLTGDTLFYVKDSARVYDKDIYVYLYDIKKEHTDSIKFEANTCIQNIYNDPTGRFIYITSAGGSAPYWFIDKIDLKNKTNKIIFEKAFVSIISENHSGFTVHYYLKASENCEDYNKEWADVCNKEWADMIDFDGKLIESSDTIKTPR